MSLSRADKAALKVAREDLKESILSIFLFDIEHYYVSSDDNENLKDDEIEFDNGGCWDIVSKNYFEKAALTFKYLNCFSIIPHEGEDEFIFDLALLNRKLVAMNQAVGGVLGTSVEEGDPAYSTLSDLYTETNDQTAFSYLHTEDLFPFTVDKRKVILEWLCRLNPLLSGLTPFMAK